MNPPEHRDHAPPPRVNESSFRSFLSFRTPQGVGNGQRQPDAPPTLKAFAPSRRVGWFSLWERLTSFFRKQSPQQQEPDISATQPVQPAPVREIPLPPHGDAIPTLGRANPADQSRHRTVLIAGGIVIAMVIVTATILLTHTSTT